MNLSTYKLRENLNFSKKTKDLTFRDGGGFLGLTLFAKMEFAFSCVESLSLTTNFIFSNQELSLI